MATAKGIPASVMDKQLQKTISDMLGGMVHGMIQEANKIVKKGMAQGQKEVIGDTQGTQAATRRQRNSPSKELQMYLRAGKEKNLFYKKMWETRWSKPFLKIWFNILNTKIYRSIYDTFAKVTGFLRQQFDDIFGEFTPLISFIKDIFVSVKDFMVGTVQLFWKGISKSFGFIKRIFSKDWSKGLAGVRNSIDNSRKDIGGKLNRLINAVRGQGRASSAKQTLLGATPRGRGRPRKGVAAEEGGGFFSGLFGMVTGGILGKLLTSAIPLILGGIGLVGAWGWVSKWLEDNPKIKREVDEIKDIVWGYTKDILSSVWDGVKSVVGSIGKSIWQNSPAWALIPTIGIGIAYLAKKMMDAWMWIQSAMASTGGGFGGGVPGKPGPSGGGMGKPGGKGIPPILKGGKAILGKLPIAGMAIGAALDYWSTGSVTRAGASAVGGGLGFALGSALGTPMVGGLIGGAIGGVVGDMIGEKLDSIFGSKSGTGEAHASMIPGSPGIPAAEFKSRTAMVESGGGAAWANPNSTARGKYQFLVGTWNDYAARAGVGLAAKGMSKEVDPRASEAAQEKVMDLAIADYTAALKAAGLPVTQGNLYLCHFLGQDAAVKALKGNRDAAISTFMSPKQIAANPSMSKLSANQIAKNFESGKKMASGAAAAAAASGGGILDALLGGMMNDPLIKMFFGDDLAEIEKNLGSITSGNPLTREEMATRTGDTGQGTSALQAQEAALSSQQTAGGIVANAIPDQYAAPAGAGIGSASASSSTPVEASGTSDPPATILGNGIPMWIYAQNNI